MTIQMPIHSHSWFRVYALRFYVWPIIALPRLHNNTGNKPISIKLNLNIYGHIAIIAYLAMQSTMQNIYLLRTLLCLIVLTFYLSNSIARNVPMDCRKCRQQYMYYSVHDTWGCNVVILPSNLLFIRFGVYLSRDTTFVLITASCHSIVKYEYIT